MHHMRYKSLRLKSLKYLRRLRNDIDTVIKELEVEPIRDVDIAEGFNGSPELVAEIVNEPREPASRGRVVRSEKIYCSEARCDRCPHGPFLFEYPTGGTGQVKFVGIPAFDMKLIDEAIARGEQMGLKNNLRE